jgi:hypothetical protein
VGEPIAANVHWCGAFFRTPAHQRRPMAKPVTGDMVEPHLNDEFGPQRLPFAAPLRDELAEERQPQGIAAAKTRGVYKGRKPKIDPAVFHRLRHEEKLGAAAKLCGGAKERLRASATERRCATNGC